MSAPSPAARQTPPPVPGGNRWRTPRVAKVVVNVGVGESGERRAKAEKVLRMLTNQKPVATRSHSTNRDFGIREGQEIGVKVTLRGETAVDFLRRAFEARDKQFDPDSIDAEGNFSFGIRDYTDFTGMKYDPGIGIFGMDISVEMGRAGWRVRDRRSQRASLPSHVRVSVEETRTFLVERFGVTLLE
ncbi:MAG: 50S ribosomal protein L5 [Thermoplasmata archaeon]|nr:50S ribosomal protein L5 [Thermoplasmata archaeon]